MVKRHPPQARQLTIAVSVGPLTEGAPAMATWKMKGRRHMRALGAANKTRQANLARLPSDEGYTQSHLLLSRLVEKGEQDFTRSFSSPAARAVLLNGIITAGLGLSIEIVPELFHPQQDTEIGKAYARVIATMASTDCTLRPHCAHTDWPALREYGKTALVALINQGIYNSGISLVTGHFPNLPLLFLAVVGGENTDLGKQIIDTPLVETAGYTAIFEGHRFVNLQFDD